MGWVVLPIKPGNPASSTYTCFNKLVYQAPLTANRHTHRGSLRPYERPPSESAYLQAEPVTPSRTLLGVKFLMPKPRRQYCQFQRDFLLRNTGGVIAVFSIFLATDCFPSR
jgi:hypothetical protein